jgi:outer membrane protein OmpA-like peptidoglycan-associated protein
MSEGVDAPRITTRGFGESFPRVPTRDGVSEPRNRRVEITLVPDTRES